MAAFLQKTYPDSDSIYKHFLESDFANPSFEYAKQEFVVLDFGVDFIFDQLEMWLFGTVEEHIEFIEFEGWFLQYESQLRDKILADLK